jgi:hypothetical protein
MRSLILILLLLCLNVQAEDTNTYYITDDGSWMLSGHQGTILTDPVALAEAKKQRECLPADEFPEGNWGEIRDGMQLSMRFETNYFALGQPIKAILLIRNVTNVLSHYWIAYFSYTSEPPYDGPIRFVTTDSNGTPLSIKPRDTSDVSSRKKAMLPKTQHKYVERLDSYYNLQSNTVYFVAAEIYTGNRKLTMLKSAKVAIRIGN